MNLLFFNQLMMLSLYLPCCLTKSLYKNVSIYISIKLSKNIPVVLKFLGYGIISIKHFYWNFWQSTVFTKKSKKIHSMLPKAIYLYAKRIVFKEQFISSIILQPKLHFTISREIYLCGSCLSGFHWNSNSTTSVNFQF